MLNFKGETFRIVMFFIVVFLAVSFSVSFSNWGHSYGKNKTYELHSLFEEVGNLRVGAPVKVSGVLVGVVDKIMLNNDYQAKVFYRVTNDLKVPEDSSIKIVTQGVLGGNYLSITPGVSMNMLKNNSELERSHSAFIMEIFLNKALSGLSSKGDK